MICPLGTPLPQTEAAPLVISAATTQWTRPDFGHVQQGITGSTLAEDVPACQDAKFNGDQGRSVGRGRLRRLHERRRRYRGPRLRGLSGC
jgi:hypothetical protein